MTPLKILFLPTEPTEKKSVFDMNHSTVDGYLLAEHLEKQINDMTDVGFLFLRMEPIIGMRSQSGVAANTTIGYLLFFEKPTSS